MQLKIGYLNRSVARPALSLQARLAKDFDIGLPELDCQADDFTVEGYLKLVEHAVRGKPEWSVSRDMYVGFFSFAKFVMWKDLDQVSWPCNLLGVKLHEGAEHILRTDTLWQRQGLIF